MLSTRRILRSSRGLILFRPTMEPKSFGAFVRHASSDVPNLSGNISESSSDSILSTVSDAVSAVSGTPELSDKFTHYAMTAIDNIHSFTGMPYWEAIILTTIGIRLVLLPLGIKTAKSAARMAAMRPESEKIQQKFNSDQNSGHPQVRLLYQQEMTALFKKHKVNPFGSLLLPLVQLPLFMTFFFALQDMPTYFPALATGGDFWFVDLSAPDSTYIFPVLNSLSFMIMIELGADGVQNQSQTFKMVMRGFSLLVIPMTLTMPQSVFMYWMPNNVISLAQALFLKNSSVKKWLDIPDAPAISPSLKPGNPFAFIMEEYEKNKAAKNRAVEIIDGKAVELTPPPVAAATPKEPQAPPITFSAHPITKKPKN